MHVYINILGFRKSIHNINSIDAIYLDRLTGFQRFIAIKGVIGGVHS